MKKLLSILLTFVMMFSFVGMTASATETETGSITVNGISNESTYEIYKLLDLESYNTTSAAYSYKINSDWSGFFATTEALAYVTIDTQGYVTWKAAEDDVTVATFAKLALAYAKDTSHPINPVKSSETDGNFVVTGTTGKFSDLSLGYYLVDSTVGALCGLTTTNPDAAINAKNAIPTIDKQVQEDSTSQWGASNTADIGQTINYRVTINVHAGAENYVLHDEMGTGLTYDRISSIEHYVSTTNTTEPVDSSYYQIVTAGLEDGETFEIRFTKAFCDHLNTNDKVIIQYSAMLNRNAVIAGAGNVNTAYLSFGEGNDTEEDSVITKTFGIDIVKTDSQNKLIDGAKFKIYDAATDGNEIKVVPLMQADDTTPIRDANGNPMYRRARENETGVSIPVEDGIVKIVGFDNGNYYLEETVTPQGYNKLDGRQLFTVSDNNLDAVFNDGIFSTGSGVHVVNKTGNMLPETGGMGTTLFVSLGAIVVLGTGVLLVTKKRMSMIDD